MIADFDLAGSTFTYLRTYLPRKYLPTVGGTLPPYLPGTVGTIVRYGIEDC